MAILHGTWSISGQFLLWGETWRKVQPQLLSPGQTSLQHPLTLDPASLDPLIRSLTDPPIADSLAPATWQLSLPTAIAAPPTLRKTKANPTLEAPI
ncbi:MAG: hypothetical protein VKK80_01085, partial [Prochlorothrix sp.]|nr:hypothetical protein [Prochlorothrix sp.]